MIGTIFLLFYFGSQLKGEDEWIQPVKMFVYLIGLFLMISANAIGIQQLRADSVDASVIGIFVWFYIAMLILVIPITVIFLLRFFVALMEWMAQKKSKSGGGWQ